MEERSEAVESRCEGLRCPSISLRSMIIGVVKNGSAQLPTHMALGGKGRTSIFRIVVSLNNVHSPLIAPEKNILHGNVFFVPIRRRDFISLVQRAEFVFMQQALGASNLPLKQGYQVEKVVVARCIC